MEWILALVILYIEVWVNSAVPSSYLVDRGRVVKWPSGDKYLSLLSSNRTLGVTTSSIDLEKWIARVSSDEPCSVACTLYVSSCCQRRQNRAKPLRWCRWVGWQDMLIQERKRLSECPGHGDLGLLLQLECQFLSQDLQLWILKYLGSTVWQHSGVCHCSRGCLVFLYLHVCKNTV